MGDDESASAPDPDTTAGIREGMRQMLESSPIPTFVLDHEHVITHWNRALATISGRPAEAMIGTRSQWIAFYRDERPVLADLIIDRAEPDEVRRYYGNRGRPSALIDGAYEAEDFFTGLQGGGRWLYFTAAPLIDASGRIVGAIETMQDTTERKTAEDKLAHYKDQLEELIAQRTRELCIVNEELSHYAYAVSHDLRSPLRAIRNYSDFLLQDLEPVLSDEHRGYMSGLRQALQQGEELVSDLLELSAVGRSVVARDAIPLESFISEIVEAMALGNDVKVRMAAGLPVVRAERTLLGQIFRNLVSNAVKFNAEPEKIVEISARDVSPERCEVCVRDNGIGIEPRFHEQIFGVFTRLHTHREYPGTGIGLAIVRKAATRLDCEVSVESSPGEGSRFRLTLPLAESEGRSE